jgi:hypothetical protein
MRSSLVIWKSSVGESAIVVRVKLCGTSVASGVNKKAFVKAYGRFMEIFSRRVSTDTTTTMT